RGRPAGEQGEVTLQGVVALHRKHLVDRYTVLRQRQEAGVILADGIGIEVPLDAGQHRHFLFGGELVALQERTFVVRRDDLVEVPPGELEAGGFDDLGADKSIAYAKRIVLHVDEQEVRHELRNLGRIDVGAARQPALAPLALPVVVELLQARAGDLIGAGDDLHALLRRTGATGGGGRDATQLRMAGRRRR